LCNMEPTQGMASSPRRESPIGLSAYCSCRPPSQPADVECRHRSFRTGRDNISPAGSPIMWWKCSPLHRLNQRRPPRRLRS
jgi:hypothetical protein